MSISAVYQTRFFSKCCYWKDNQGLRELQDKLSHFPTNSLFESPSLSAQTAKRMEFVAPQTPSVLQSEHLDYESPHVLISYQGFATIQWAQSIHRPGDFN